MHPIALPRSGPAIVRAASRFRPPLHGAPGQAVVELAVALPVLVALAMLVFAGGRLLATSVALADAARAGAVAAASDVARGQPGQAESAAVAAAAGEGAPLSCAGDGIPADCVAVATATGGSSGEPMEVVTVYDRVDTGVPGLPPLQIQQQAVATP